jgi:oxygen-independent coproporphyrinogen-3 oxidase
MAQAAGYVHYEISNFAKPGHVSRHNLKYWRNENCLGAGVSSAWYVDGVRRKNTDNLTDYMVLCASNRSPVVEESILTGEDRLGEDLMLGLRTRWGAVVTPEAKALYGAAMDEHVADGLLLWDGNRILPTRRGWLLSNRVFQDLLSPGKSTGPR